MLWITKQMEEMTGVSGGQAGDWSRKGIIPQALNKEGKEKNGRQDSYYTDDHIELIKEAKRMRDGGNGLHYIRQTLLPKWSENPPPAPELPNMGTEPTPQGTTMGYLIITAANVTTLEERVLGAIDKGWIPLGGVAIESGGILQAMIKSYGKDSSE